jgi:hypothetical protein
VRQRETSACDDRLRSFAGGKLSIRSNKHIPI